MDDHTGLFSFAEICSVPGSLNYFPPFRNRKNDVSRRKSRVIKLKRGNRKNLEQGMRSKKMNDKREKRGRKESEGKESQREKCEQGESSKRKDSKKGER